MRSFRFLLTLKYSAMLLLSLPANAQLQNLYTCKARPPFLEKRKDAFKKYNISTTDRFHMGLVVLNTDTSAKAARFYQHSSWRAHGYLGNFVITERGEIIVIPVPSINVLNNPKEEQNTIYKTNPETGALELFVKLPSPPIYNADNPFGLMGLTYDCASGMLYASSVYGSDRQNEKGVIYAISTAGGKALVVDSLYNVDAFGLCVLKIKNSKVLLFSSARNSYVVGMVLDSAGMFTNKKRMAVNLLNLGPRGDDKVRKMRVTESGDLMVYGVSFNWNLIAPTEKQETEYTFRWNPQTSQFVLIDIQNPHALIGY